MKKELIITDKNLATKELALEIIGRKANDFIKGFGDGLTLGIKHLKDGHEYWPVCDMSGYLFNIGFGGYVYTYNIYNLPDLSGDVFYISTEISEM